MCSYMIVRKVSRGKNSPLQFTFGIDSFSNVAFKVNLKNAKCFFPVSSDAITLNLSYLVYFFICNYGELIG